MNKRGQVWVETVIYTLIGLVVIGMLLAFAKPQVELMRDKSIIQQSLASFNNLNSKIEEIRNSGPGNSRDIELKISKGRILIDPDLNKISWILDSTYKFSEPGYIVSSGDLKVNTTQKGSKSYLIEIFKSYGLEIVVNEEKLKKEIAQSPSPYTLVLRNQGIEPNTGQTILDILI